MTCLVQRGFLLILLPVMLALSLIEAVVHEFPKLAQQDLLYFREMWKEAGR